MISLKSESYPYLAVAKVFRVPYSEVLRYVELWESRKPVYVTEKWHIALSQAYSREQERRKLVQRKSLK
jgi:hypothetical protein